MAATVRLTEGKHATKEGRDMKENLLKSALAVEQEMLEWRRWLHQNPELSFQEVKTSAFIEEKLRSFNIEVSRPTVTGVIGRLKGAKSGRVIGIRADIDALPMQEETDLAFASLNAGVMHSCGHDGHTAILLAAAKLLSGMRDQIQGEIRFIFQHAEELPPGGAAEMVKSGVADGVDAMYGLHLSSAFPTGVFGLRVGALTSATDRFDIVIQGKGGHSAFPEQCVDPVITGAQVITALQTVISRNTAAIDMAVLSACHVRAGNAYNIIPNTMEISGSVRTFSELVRAAVPQQIERIVSGTTQAAGAEYTFQYSLGYDSVINDQALTSQVEDLILKSYGEAHRIHIQPLMHGEGFSAFLAKCPGCFLELGSGNAEKGCDRPHHNPQYRMDEEAMVYGVDYYLRLAELLLMDKKK